MTERAGPCGNENSKPATSGTLEAAVPSWRTNSGRTGPEAAIHELQGEDDRHQQDEVLEREDVAECDAALAIRGQLVVHGALVVHPEHEHERAGVEDSRDEKGAAQADGLRYGATDDRTDAGPSRWAVCMIPIAEAIRSRGAESAAIVSVSEP